MLHRKVFWGVGGLTLLCFVYFFPYFPSYRDALLYVYPVKHYTVSEIVQGRLPLFNPFNGEGERWWANVQTGVLYPPSYFFILPPAPAFWLYILFHHLIFAWGIYYWLSGYFSKRTALLFSLVGTLSGPFFSTWDLSFAMASLSYFPLVLGAIHQKHYPLFTLGLSLSFLGGEPFVALVIWGSAFVFAIVQRLSFLRIFIVFFLALLIVTPALIPFTDLFIHSDRAAGLNQGIALRDSLSFLDWVKILGGTAWGKNALHYTGIKLQSYLPSLYLGVLCLFLTFLSLWKSSWKNYILFLLFALTIALAMGASSYFYTILKPLYQVIRYPSRMLWFALIPMLYLSAWSWEHLKKVGIVGLAGLGMYGILFLLHPLHPLYLFIHMVIFLSLLFMKKRSPFFLAGLFCLDFVLPWLALTPFCNTYGLDLHSPFAASTSPLYRIDSEVDGKKEVRYMLSFEDNTLFANMGIHIITGYTNLLHPVALQISPAPLHIQRKGGGAFYPLSFFARLEFRSYGVAYHRFSLSLPFLLGLQKPLRLEAERYQDNTYCFSVDNLLPQKVVAGLLYDPYLRVMIDDKPVNPTSYKNHLSFQVPQGKHTVTIQYREPYFLFYLIIGLFSLLYVMIQWYRHDIYASFDHSL